jgi:alanine racemase
MAIARDPHFSDCASWLELDASALRHNAALLSRLIGPSSRLGCVLKANAYGHGLSELLPVVHPLCEAIYVIDPRDALAVRAFEQASGAPTRQVLVLGAVSAEEAVALARADVDVTLADAGFSEFLPSLRAAGLSRPLRVHLHLDTGLSREGFTVDRLPEDAAFLTEARDVVELSGALSHFANTEDVTEQRFAAQQLSAFQRGLAKLQPLLPPGAPPLQRHLAASAAAMLLPEARLDIVRAGIALYGLWPSSETRLSARVLTGSVPELMPVLAWRCRSQLVKRLPAGSFVGYGCTYRCPADTTIAVLPVGYFDGYPRLVSGRAHVLVSGERCPVLGRVMMNHLVIDVTRAAQGRTELCATLIGRDGDEQLSADALADWAQTINYEIVARLPAHLRRIVV